jgi:hypothetical protein
MEAAFVDQIKFLLKRFRFINLDDFSGEMSIMRD